MKTAKVLCICGSGVVSSSMVAMKLKDLMSERGYDVSTVETNPPGIDLALEGGNFDFILCVSPVYDDYDIPKVNGIGLLTGLSEEQVIDDCVAVLEKRG
jgi:PTS system galactitol-specific IIB component